MLQSSSDSAQVDCAHFADAELNFKINNFSSEGGKVFLKKFLRLHIRFARRLRLPCVFASQTLHAMLVWEWKNSAFSISVVERKFSAVEAMKREDKCFIEFNYVEMFIMSCVYKRRKALSIKSREKSGSEWKSLSFQSLVRTGKIIFIALSC